jgi:hypothetical protein
MAGNNLRPAQLIGPLYFIQKCNVMSFGILQEFNDAGLSGAS